MKRVAHLSTEAPVSHSWAEILFPWLYRSDFTYTRVTDFLFCFLVELTPNKKVKKPLVVFVYRSKDSFIKEHQPPLSNLLTRNQVHIPLCNKSRYVTPTDLTPTGVNFRRDHPELIMC